LRADVEVVRDAAERSAELTRQLLAFARKQTTAPQVLALNQTVGGMLKMLRRLIGEEIELVWKPRARHDIVKLDPSQVDRVMTRPCSSGWATALLPREVAVGGA
jgi:C4-dicarboxylate-specific signal transduction histidine kinase